MDGAITSGVQRDGARRNDVQRNRLDRGECHEDWSTEKRCEEGLCAERKCDERLWRERPPAALQASRRAMYGEVMRGRSGGRRGSLERGKSFDRKDERIDGRFARPWVGVL